MFVYTVIYYVFIFSAYGIMYKIMALVPYGFFFTPSTVI